LNILIPVDHILMYLVQAASADGVMGMVGKKQLPKIMYEAIRVFYPRQCGGDRP
jgi:hypothetical protein